MRALVIITLVSIASRFAKLLLMPLSESAVRARALWSELRPVLTHFQRVFLSYYAASLLLIFILYFLYVMLSQGEKDPAQLFESATAAAFLLSPLYLSLFELFASNNLYDRFLRHSLSASLIGNKQFHVFSKILPTLMFLMHLTVYLLLGYLIQKISSSTESLLPLLMLSLLMFSFAYLTWISWAYVIYYGVANSVETRYGKKVRCLIAELLTLELRVASASLRRIFFFIIVILSLPFTRSLILKILSLLEPVFYFLAYLLGRLSIELSGVALALIAAIELVLTLRERRGESTLPSISVYRAKPALQGTALEALIVNNTKHTYIIDGEGCIASCNDRGRVHVYARHSGTSVALAPGEKAKVTLTISAVAGLRSRAFPAAFTLRFRYQDEKGESEAFRTYVCIVNPQSGEVRLAYQLPVSL